MMFHVTVFHNTDGRFRPFRRDHRLVAAFAFSRALPQDTTADQLAEWTFGLLNTDPDKQLGSHPTVGAVSAFLLACRYRQRRLRSLSVGDVVRVSTAAGACWLACDGLGWTAIAPPANVHAATDGAISATGESQQQRTAAGEPTSR